jgi:hypothetical protein
VPAGENVQVTLNGVTKNAALDSNDNFSVSFPSNKLALAGSPYTIGFAYAGDANFASTSGSSKLTVNRDAFTYQIGNATQIYGTPAKLANDLGTTINTGVNGETLGITYSSSGDTTTALVGTYPISGALSNGSGLLANYKPTLKNGTLTVEPASVNAGISGPPDGVLYQPRSFTFTASSAPGDAAVGYTYAINWGDSSPIQTISAAPNNSSIIETHEYTTTGTFTVSVAVTDQFNIVSAKATEPIQIGIAAVEADASGQGGVTALAVSGTFGSQGVVLTGAAGNSMQVTRGGTVLGTFVATGGNIALYGDGGTDLVAIDGITTSFNTFTLTGSTATFTAAAFGSDLFTIGLNGISQVTLKGGNSGDSFTNTAAAVPSILLGDAGTDSYTFAGSSMGAAATIQDAGGSNTLNAPTLAASQPNTWTINGTNSGNLNGVNWTFSGVQNLIGSANHDVFQFAAAGSIAGNLNAGTGGGTLNYKNYSGNVSVNLETNTATRIGGQVTNLMAAIGGSGSNTLIAANANHTWHITGQNAGDLDSTFNFSAFANLTGGSGNDAFVFSDAQGVTGIINGGGGTNGLDYSAYSAGIDVNLRTQLATGTGGIRAIQRVFGGSGNDILVGMGSGILLQAGSGNDLIIGGYGQTTIKSGSGQDIVIAGSTKYDANDAALQSILQYWDQTSISFAARVAQLFGAGTPVGGYKLNLTTLTHANASDTLTLGSASDWVFWRSSGSSPDNLTGTPKKSTFI